LGEFCSVTEKDIELFITSYQLDRSLTSALQQFCPELPLDLAVFEDCLKAASVASNAVERHAAKVLVCSVSWLRAFVITESAMHFETVLRAIVVCQSSSLRDLAINLFDCVLEVVATSAKVLDFKSIYPLLDLHVAGAGHALVGRIATWVPVVGANVDAALAVLRLFEMFVARVDDVARYEIERRLAYGMRPFLIRLDGDSFSVLQALLRFVLKETAYLILSQMLERLVHNIQSGDVVYDRSSSVELEPPPFQMIVQSFQSCLEASEAAQPEFCRCFIEIIDTSGSSPHFFDIVATLLPTVCSFRFSHITSVMIRILFETPLFDQENRVGASVMAMRNCVRQLLTDHFESSFLGLLSAHLQNPRILLELFSLDSLANPNIEFVI
jgi:hypothetical protein